MPDSIRQIELILNEYQADIHIVQIVLQHLIIMSLHATPNRQETLAAIQQFVRETLEKSPNISDDQQDGKRLQKLMEARADRFFQPMNTLFGLSPATPQSDVN